jgi:hypothetical protein
VGRAETSERVACAYHMTSPGLSQSQVVAKSPAPRRGGDNAGDNLDCSSEEPFERPGHDRLERQRPRRRPSGREEYGRLLTGEGEDRRRLSCASAPSPRTPPLDRSTEYRSLRTAAPGSCQQRRKVRAMPFESCLGGQRVHRERVRRDDVDAYAHRSRWRARRKQEG